MFATLATVAATLLMSGAAFANPPGSQPPPNADQDRMQQRQSREMVRPDPRFDEAEARRRAAMMQERDAALDASRRNQRLTPEERRDLRRQIDETARTLYKR
ncbi:MAG TPA: hypothetical protein VIT92_10490 [Burkholderiaceae bacterium]